MRAGDRIQVTSRTRWAAGTPRAGALLRRWGPRVVVLVALALALGERSAAVTEWPMQFHPTLQYENALTARRIWLHLRPEPWSEAERRWLADWHGRMKAPPVLESLTALTYLVDGRERPWTAGLFTSAFWLLGGLFLLDLGRRIGGGRWGAVSSLAFYLLAPFAVVVSRSFQHEALMVAAFLAALWVMERSAALAGWRGTLLSGVACGVAGLVKPGIVLLPLLGAEAARAVRETGVRRAVLSPRTYVFAALAVSPSAAYGLVFLGGESHQLQPHLLLTAMFYRWWAANVLGVVGGVPLLLGIAGACAMAVRHGRFLGLGLLAGYLAYALVFTYANMTHDYYLVPLLVIVAVCLGPLVEAAVQALARIGGPVVAELGAAAAVLTGLLAMAAAGTLPPPEEAERARGHREVGAALGAGRRVMTLSHAYGFALMYHGWLSTYWWPDSGDKWAEGLRGEVIADDVRFGQRVAELRPSHFVVTELDELARQPELAALLRAYCVQLRRPDAIVYDLRTRCAGDGAPAP